MSPKPLMTAPHPFERGRKQDEGAALCRHCEMTLTAGPHGDREILLAEVKQLRALLEDTRARGAERLKAAEDLCVMYSWSAAHAQTNREKAAHELWRRWYAIVGSDFLTADAHPDLSDAMVDLLAAQRDETRARTLARIRSDAPTELPGGDQ